MNMIKKHFASMGFTLIELLMVVLIIGILTSVAVPKYRRSVYRAEMLEGLTNGKTIYDSAVRYRGINSVAPTAFSQLDIGFEATSSNPNEFVDGSFTYILPSTTSGEFVKVSNTKAGYDLLFMFPEVTETGVTMPILCCGYSTSATGDWLCNSMGVPADNEYLSAKSLISTCTEIK